MTQPKPLLCSLCCNNPAVYNLAVLPTECLWQAGMVGELISDTYKRWSQKQKNHT